MEGASLTTILDMAGKVGLPGVLVVLWWLSDRAHARHMDEIRHMYENNVKLVNAYEVLAKSQESTARDLKDVVILNTQILTQVCQDVETNQFCPYVRLQKRAPGPVQGSER